MQLRLADFVLDTDTRDLRRGATPVHLSPKAFELLTLLVTSRPRALSKAHLLDQLWPDTFVVEKNLTNLVGEIRDALGDQPSDPVFIRTVYGFGYAFRGLVEGDERADRGVPGESGVARLAWQGGRVTLGEGEHVLGRDPDAAVFLDSPGASRRHAVIRVAAGRATLEDLGSKNGTQHLDRQLDGPVPLNDGDTIRIGSVTLTFSFIRIAGSTLTEA